MLPLLAYCLPVTMHVHTMIRSCLVLGLAFMAGSGAHAQSSGAGEPDLWRLWTKNASNINDHASMVIACRETKSKLGQDPLGVVVQGLEAWHLLEMKNFREAAKVLEVMAAAPAGASFLPTAGAEMARGWLTRIDREAVRGALQKCYLRDIEYPDSLDQIKTLKFKTMPPMMDRWGAPWVYQLHSSIKGMKSQQYILESTRLGSKSDLARTLAIPYGANINFEPVRVSPVSAETYEFSSPLRKSILLQAGSAMDGITMAYMGANIIVLTDGIHWRVVVKPR